MTKSRIILLQILTLMQTADVSEGTVVNLTHMTFGIGTIAPDIITSSSGPTFRGGFINEALFREPSVQGSSGSGVFRDLYRLTPPNGKDNVTESGYNRVEMDSKIPNGFNSVIRMSDLVEDTSGGSYIFVIDIAEANNQESFLSLDDFKVWVGATTDPEKLPADLGALRTELGIPAYDMNPSGSSNVVLMDARLSSGSGGGDAFIFIPKSKFGPNPDPNALVYVYAAMGGYTAEPGFGAGSTHEQVSMPGKSYVDGNQVAVIGAGVSVPESSSMLLVLLSLAGASCYRRR